MEGSRVTEETAFAVSRLCVDGPEFRISTGRRRISGPRTAGDIITPKSNSVDPSLQSGQAPPSADADFILRCRDRVDEGDRMRRAMFRRENLL